MVVQRAFNPLVRVQFPIWVFYYFYPYSPIDPPSDLCHQAPSFILVKVKDCSSIEVIKANGILMS